MIMTRKKSLRVLAGVVAGGIAGFLYWQFIGCNAGSCPLTSNPYNTVMLFAATGGLMAWDNKQKGTKDKTN